MIYLAQRSVMSKTEQNMFFDQHTLKNDTKICILIFWGKQNKVINGLYCFIK